MLGSCSRQILAHMSKPIAGFFNFNPFNLYYTESREPPWGLFESRSLFVRNHLGGVGLYEGDLFGGGGFIKSLW